MRTRGQTLQIVIVCSVAVIFASLAGCVTTSDSPGVSQLGPTAADSGIAPLAPGAKAEYAATGVWGGELEIVVGPRASVRTADGRTIESTLLFRWYNGSDGSAFSYVDAIDAANSVVWTMDVCKPISPACDGRHTFHFPSAAVSNLAFDPTTIDSGCEEVDERTDIVQSDRLGIMPPLTLTTALWCDGEAFPRELRTYSPGIALSRVSQLAGRGDPVKESTASAPSQQPLSREQWNGFGPPGPEPDNGFLLSEALGWLERNSSEFREFREQNRGVYLKSTALGGSGKGAVRELPLVGSPEYTRTQERNLVFGSDGGSDLSLTLVKTTAAVGPQMIEESRATVSRSAPFDFVDAAEPLMISAKSATDAGMDALGGRWTDTEVRAETTSPRALESHPVSYLYWVVSAPSEPAGAMVQLTNLAVIAGDSGMPVYLFGPASTWIQA